MNDSDHCSYSLKQDILARKSRSINEDDGSSCSRFHAQFMSALDLARDHYWSECRLLG